MKSLFPFGLGQYMSKNLRLVASKIRRSERRRKNRSGIFVFYINRVYYHLITVRLPDQEAVEAAIYELACIDDPHWDEMIETEPKIFWDYCCSLLKKHGDVIIKY